MSIQNEPISLRVNLMRLPDAHIPASVQCHDGVPLVFSIGKNTLEGSS